MTQTACWNTPAFVQNKETAFQIFILKELNKTPAKIKLKILLAFNIKPDIKNNLLICSILQKSAI